MNYRMLSLLNIDHLDPNLLNILFLIPIKLYVEFSSLFKAFNWEFINYCCRRGTATARPAPQPRPPPQWRPRGTRSRPAPDRPAPRPPTSRAAPPRIACCSWRPQNRSPSKKVREKVSQRKEEWEGE